MIKTAVLGVGRFGARHAACLSRLPSSHLVALVDPSPHVGALARSLGARWVPSVRNLPKDVVAASVATPLEAHYEVARALLERGVHVLVEKPFTQSAAEATQLETLANKLGLVLQVGHIERYNPAFILGREALRQARSVRGIRTSAYPPPAAALDVVTDLMIHDLDLLLEGVGAPVVGVSGRGRTLGIGHIDEAEAVLRFANGCIAHLTAAWGGADAAALRQMTVEDGRGVRSTLDFQSQDVRPRELVETGVRVDTLERELTEFLAACRGCAPCSVGPRAGWAAMELAQSIRDEIITSMRGIWAVAAGGTAQHRAADSRQPF